MEKSTVVMASSAVICDGSGRVLLIKRGNEPDRGRWSVPGGCVDPGETLEDAAAREAREETGLEVSIGKELWCVRVPIGDGRVYEIHDFMATVIGGELQAGDDAEEVRWAHRTQLDDLDLTVGLADLLRNAGLFAEHPISPDGRERLDDARFR